jgi:hypothetical protein
VTKQEKKPKDVLDSPELERLLKAFRVQSLVGPMSFIRDRDGVYREPRNRLTLRPTR